MKSIFYHSADHDGHCSGAIVQRWCEINGIEYKLYPINYGDLIPDMTGMDVVMCDFSLNRQLMEDTLKKTVNFVWIDHHISAINENHGLEIQGLRNTNFAACELTWMEFFPLEKIPKGVTFLGAYDSWRHNGDKEILGYEWYFRTFDTDPYRFNWNKMVFRDDPLRDKNFIETGILMRDKDANEWKDQMENAFEKEIQGKKVLCLNTQSKGSMIFGDKLKDYDYAVVFFCDGNGWKHSLYSHAEGADVSIIAKGFGGGGHTHASGCFTEKPIWEV